MINSKEIIKFNWLTKMSTSSLFLLMVLFPPTFLIWFFKIGQLSERQLHKRPDFFFRLMYAIFILGCTFLIVFSTINLDFNFDIYFQFVFWSMFISFMYCDFYVTRLTYLIEIDKKTNSNIAEALGRFILLSTLVFGAILLQKRLSLILNDE